nr:DNA translocase FtsK [Streptococcus marimammalium]
MTKSKNSVKTRAKKRYVTKAEKEKQAATKRLLLALGMTIVLFFAIFKLGPFGTTIYNVIRFLFGSLAYLVIFSYLIYLYAFKWIRQKDGLLGGFIMLLMGLLLEWHAYFFSLPIMRGKEIFAGTMKVIVEDLMAFQVKAFTGGGMIGALLYKPISFLFSNIGSFFIGGLFILLGLFLMTPWNIRDITEFVKDIIQKIRVRNERKRQERFLKQEEKKRIEEEKALAAIEVADEELDDVTFSSEDAVLGAQDKFFESKSYREPEIVGYVADEEEEIIYDLDDDFKEETPLNDDEKPLDVDFTPKKTFHYQLPTIDLFDVDKPKNQTREKKLVRDNIKVLEATFASFGIKVVVERAEIGPSVTKYEVKPAIGVRVNRISNLADDLALALAAKDVRIEAPIPGKSLVGIEVPNSEVATVSFRELWEQSKTDPEKLLEVPLGKAVNGTSRSFNLARMPHLLVAGSTGSGKSVAINGIIASILMKARPDQVKMMMIDPKMVELSVYNDIPHLLIPVVTNPRKASKALQKVVDEMENRYELFSRIGVRNIAGYNAKVAEYNLTSDVKQIPLPLLVVIVDELADLMMVASKEVEDAIIRLGQKARAAGIHMILATQRPSVDVISGLIKANVPSRIAFAVSSGTDSRTILDENGAEKLLGRGDMLFKPIDENHPVRLQGSFISDDDVERIVDFIKKQADADYDENFDPGEVSENDTSSDGSSGEGDPLFEEAKTLIIESQKASASMLQRRLSVGFNRATRLMEELEEAGVIGPAEGTKPRKVLQGK